MSIPCRVRANLPLHSGPGPIHHSYLISSTFALFTHFQTHWPSRCSAWAHTNTLTQSLHPCYALDVTTAFVSTCLTSAFLPGPFVGLSYIASELSSIFCLLTCFIIFLWPYSLYLLSFSARCPSLKQKFCVGEDMKTAVGELSSQELSIHQEWGQWLLHEHMHIWEDGMFWNQITYIQSPPLPSVCTVSLFVDGMNTCSGLSSKLG